MTERDKDRFTRPLLAPIFEFSVPVDRAYTADFLVDFTSKIISECFFLWSSDQKKTARVINKKQVILGEDLELKEDLTVDVSMGRNSRAD